MAAWVLSAASNYFFPPVDFAARRMISWLPTNELLRSGNRPKPQHWKSDESTEVEGTSAEDDHDLNDDSDAYWTIDSEDHSSLSGESVYAPVASDGQASLRRSISEIDLSVSEEEVIQTFAWRKKDLVGITGLCGPVVDELLLANVYDYGRDTEQYIFEVLVAGFEESERKTSDVCRKVFARARSIFPCVAPRDVGDDLEQYRACDELPLVLQWPRGRADNCVTLPADLETMDLHTRTTTLPTLRAAEPRRLRNDYEDSCDAGRSQLICSAEIALPILTCWDLLVVDKPADARSRIDKSIEQILAETTRPCPRCFVLIRRAGECMHMKCDNSRRQHEFCCLCLHDWTTARYDASFCIGSVEASHLEVLAFVEKQTRSKWAQQAHDMWPAEDTYAKEALQGFNVTLITRLESDAELISAEIADVLLRWRLSLEFYDHSETRIRVTAQVVFADVVDSYRTQQELIELLSRVRIRWWLRLSPEDVGSHNESVMDPQTFLELPCPVRRRMYAERALLSLEEHFGSQLVEYEWNMAQAQHGEEQSAWAEEDRNGECSCADSCGA